MKLLPHLLLIYCFAVAVGSPVAHAELPVSGVHVPELDQFDQTMRSFMGTNGIEAGTLAIMYQGEVVFLRGYGWLDRAHTVPLPANTMMRLASVTKPITAAAVHRLAATAELNLQVHAIETGQPGGGIVDLAPFSSLGDPRLGNITIHDLLRHRGGWDRSLAPDYTW